MNGARVYAGVRARGGSTTEAMCAGSAILKR